MFSANKLRQKYLDFFKEKGHMIIPSASLVPENDPSVLFTTAGMHPLAPYLLGEKYPGGAKRLVNAQKCVRTVDIDEVGDATHHTFFEMLGNWSLGDSVSSDGVGKAGYFKKEAIEWSFEFLTDKKWLGLDKNRLAVSVFAGDEDAPFDTEAYDIWKNLGISESRIAKLPKNNNWWEMETGPCGPDTEMFYWTGDADKVPERFNDDNDLWVEIWNDVFMQYNKTTDGKYEALAQKNVDTGMGLVRVLAAVNGLDDNYKTEIFAPVISKIEELSGKKYEKNKKAFRVIADHIQAATFIIADGVEPQNVGRGYVLRRLIRRAVRYGKLLGISGSFTKEISKVLVEIYKEAYPELEKNKNKICGELEKEENKFRETLDKGLLELNKLKLVGMAEFIKPGKDRKVFNPALGHKTFDIYQTYGFPYEMIAEELERQATTFGHNPRDIKEELEKAKKSFDGYYKEHQALSRTASVGVFKGGLQSQDKNIVKLHTATHLLNAALRKILGEHVYQKGSNITSERLRFDFSHPEKMTPEQIKKVEDLVNEQIKNNLLVKMEEMSPDKAQKQGAIGVFGHKYGETVKVYTIGKSVQGEYSFSREICGGPHVGRTGELGKFRIKKEEASSAGIRRIKAALE